MRSIRSISSLATVLAVVALLTAFFASAGSSPAATNPAPQASSAATCIALIQKGTRLVTLRQTVYKYKFKKAKGGTFRRVIVRVSVAVRVSCSTQCVVMQKKKGKFRPVYVVRRVKVVVKRGNKLVTVRRKQKTYKFGACKKTGTGTSGVPVKISILNGSYALLDFGAFQRQAPISGVVRGFVPGAIHVNSDTQVNLTSAALNLAPTPIFIDNSCNGDVTPSIRTGTPTTIGLDDTKDSISTLFASGTVTSIVYTKIHLPLDLRNDDDGCNKPYITTGYSEFTQTFFLKGKVAPTTGLSKLTLTSAPDSLDTIACLSPGAPTQPCNGFQIPLPILVSTNLIVQIQIGVK
jgi:hypothetical protein